MILIFFCTADLKLHPPNKLNCLHKVPLVLLIFYLTLRGFKVTYREAGRILLSRKTNENSWTKGRPRMGEKIKMWRLNHFPIFQMFRNSSVLLQTWSLDVILSFSVTEKQKKTKITRRASVCVSKYTVFSGHLTTLPSLAFYMATFQYWLIRICQTQYVRVYRSWGPFRLRDRTEDTT